MEMLKLTAIYKHPGKNIFLLFAMLFVFSSIYCVQENKSNSVDGQEKIKKDKDSISTEMQKILKNEFDLWYPLSLDTLYGGYFSDMNYKWELNGRQDKMIVTQARHVWSASNAAMFYKKNASLLKAATHGFKFLKNIMWDKEFGGFYNLVNRKGEPVKENNEIIKNAYGNAFSIYGLAAYYKASKDDAALKLAQETFYWLEKHSFDPKYGGYFQFLSRNGTPFTDGYGMIPPKDQNSSIHILECFSELYDVWPDALLKERLNSLLIIIRDTITTPKGYLNLFFKRDWTPITNKEKNPDSIKNNSGFDHVSFGHDIETAYLLLEASKVLGIKNDTVTLLKAKKMVDHSFKNGWDKERQGGLFDRGYYFQPDKITVIQNTKEWWAQVEAMNSLLMMSELFPKDELNYYEQFCLQWSYIKKNLWDNEHGGWYWGGIDIVPGNKLSPKGSIWKGDYHTSRALINCIRRLSKMENGF